MSETSGSACGLSRASSAPLGALLGPSWASWAVFGLSSAIFGLFWSPRRVSGHSRHGYQDCPATLAALDDPFGPFLGLCWALAWWPRTVSGHSRHGCHKRPATPAASHGPLIAVLGPFLGLCWAPHGSPGLSSDALEPFRACSGGRGESPDKADMDVRSVRQRLRPMRPSWAPWAPLRARLSSSSASWDALGPF